MVEQRFKSMSVILKPMSSGWMPHLLSLKPQEGSVPEVLHKKKKL